MSRYMDLVQKYGFAVEIKVQRAGLVARMKSGGIRVCAVLPPDYILATNWLRIGWKPLFISTVAFTGTSLGGSMKRDPPYGSKASLA